MRVLTKEFNLYDFVQSLEWYDTDEVNVKEENGKIIIENLDYQPNRETLAAIKEIEEMEKTPHLYKGYSCFAEILEELENEI